MRPVVGWIGVGNIGLPMAERLAHAGFPMRVWSRRAQAAQPLVDAGAQRTASPEDLAQACEVVVTMLGGPADVIEVQQRLLPHSRPGTLLVDMTTAAPSTALALTELAAAARVDRLDAPVTGGVAGAREGKLTIFVGGEAQSLERCRAILEALGNRIVHCGSAGAGYRMKLVNQTMMAGALLGLAEGAALARAGGLDAAFVADALGAGSASGPLLRSYLPRMVEPGGAVTFTLGMLRKDLTLARDEAHALGGNTRLLAFALASVDEACARFGAEAGVQWLAAARRD
jgi:3-hydroxyisobutyrate dehydrogenase-like beta-hydroxyacid dehydrogenase